MSPERRARVDDARKRWSDQLIDRSRRNNLLYFRKLEKGTLDFSGADPDDLAALLAGEAILLRRLAPDADEARAFACLREIQRRALANLEERGLETLFLAIGMATWPVADGGRPPEAAILLVPIRVEWQGRESRAASLRRCGEAQVSLVLLHALEVDHRCPVAAEALLAPEQSDGEDAAVGDQEEDLPPQYTTVYRRLEEAACRVPGFAVEHRAVLGNFAFQKMAMVRDLQELGEELAAHDVIAAIAGDPDARAAVRVADREVDLRELDDVAPDDEYLVRDADSSQQAVVVAARSGQHLVIQGPPGTGKSQTIANLIATLAADGRRILFVAEKRAALEVVRDWLKEAGLEHLTLDLHGADLSRRAILDRLKGTWERVRSAPPVEAEETHRCFAEARRRLNDHAARLHERRAPSDINVYELQGRLLRMSESIRSATRWRAADLQRLDATVAYRIRELLHEGSAFDGLLTRDGASPWTGAELRDGSAVQEALDAAVRIVDDRWPAAEAALREMATVVPLPPTVSPEEAGAIAALVGVISCTLQRYSPDLFRQDLSSLVAALAPVSRGPLSRLWALCVDGDFRKARAAARTLRLDAGVPDAELLRELTAARAQGEEWRRRLPAAPVPSKPVDLQTTCRVLDALVDDLAILSRALGRQLETLPLQDVISLVARLAADRHTPHRIPRLLQIEEEIRQRGAEAILREIRSRKPAAEQWPRLFEHAWLASCLDHARLEDPLIAGFNGRTHDGVIKSFRESDRERLKRAADRVRRAHAERLVQSLNEHPEQAALVQRQIEKKSGHLPLRTLVARAPQVLTALAPCWMASPLSVSQLLPGDRALFDVVIFDEASQVLPHDAVPSLLRAKQAVVAGDEHQLPPTLFFADGGDDDDDDIGDEVGGFESLLQLIRAVVGRAMPLQWHYRSRDESLITFSNREIYTPAGQELITFPGPRAQNALSHVLVEQPLGHQEQSESSAEEVRRVVQLVIEHAHSRPSESLGVIAMGIKHAQRIEFALDAARRDHPELDPFFDEETLHKRFFVKNLERVQGDQRDAILLSIGYGKDATGKLLYRFGPLNQEGGHRRLNVAVTRARRRMTVVSSFSHLDLNPERCRARGVVLLRSYLQYAASGGKSLGDRGSSETPLNPFEADVLEALTQRGMSLLPQWGVSRYRIDLVAQHPTQPDRLVLAIECDGASYHAAPTARDRDRLRQQHLEALGWRFHRIWSTDWFMRRDEEIQRAWVAYEAAVADAEEPSPNVLPVPPVPSPPSPPSTRGPRPPVPPGKNITQYSPAELQTMVSWLSSDGRLRTDAELVVEMLGQLGFQRLGARIEEAFRKAIEAVRRPLDRR